MKKIGRSTFALFAITFMLYLLATAPATLLGRAVEGASNGRFTLANASGSVWQGNATPAIRQRAGSFLALEKLHWKIELMPIFTGKIIVRFRWDNSAQEQAMIATVSSSQIVLRNAVIPLQAEVLGELAPMLQPVQLSGKMQIKSDQFTFSGKGMTGSAVADWTNAGSVLSAVSPLGSYRINLAGAGEHVAITLITVSGVLMLEGTGSFTPSQGLLFKGTARAAADSKGSIDELLGNFGPESAPGVHALNLMR